MMVADIFDRILRPWDGYLTKDERIDKEDWERFEWLLTGSEEPVDAS